MVFDVNPGGAGGAIGAGHVITTAAGETITLAAGKNVSFAGAFTTAGGDLTFTVTAATNVTLPTSGTLATLSGSRVTNITPNADFTITQGGANPFQVLSAGALDSSLIINAGKVSFAAVTASGALAQVSGMVAASGGNAGAFDWRGTIKGSGVAAVLYAFGFNSGTFDTGNVAGNVAYGAYLDMTSAAFTIGTGSFARTGALFVKAAAAGALNYSLHSGGGTVRIDGASAALGGGAAPTLGTIGGAGPTTAAQAKWLKIDMDGNPAFIPIWT